MCERSKSSCNIPNKEDQTNNPSSCSVRQQKQSTTIAHKLNLRPFSCILCLTSITASIKQVIALFSVRRKPMKQNHGGLFLFEPPSHNHKTCSHSNRPMQSKPHFCISHSNTTHTIVAAPPPNHWRGCNNLADCRGVVVGSIRGRSQCGLVCIGLGAVLLPVNIGGIGLHCQKICRQHWLVCREECFRATEVDGATKGKHIFWVLWMHSEQN